MKHLSCLPDSHNLTGHPDFHDCAPAAVLRELDRLASKYAPPLGMDRRTFLKSQMGLAASFLALNTFFGPFFQVAAAEAAEPDAAREQIEKYADQFIFDVQVHYVHENYPSPEGLLSLRRAAQQWQPSPGAGADELEDIQFENFFREIFENSQTSAAVLSNAPNDDKNAWFLSNEQALNTRERVNRRTGRRSLFAHAIITPGQPGWMEDLAQALELGPDAVKGYTLGDPGGGSAYPWRLDDEKLVYPAYEKLLRAGVNNVCIHKGLLPTGYKQFIPAEKSALARVDDVGKAAQDWPELNFIIYHSAIENVLPDKKAVKQFKQDGRINWVTDLARIPEQYGVDNVYAELGAVFAATCAAHPELCAGILGTLIREMGADHVCWGTDSVWFGSPQWQIEAMRRFEIPAELRKRFGYPALGEADGKIKNMIFGENSARLYGIDPAGYHPDSAQT
jgi:predicted TIM-barrel fold metal-dependent hydrolase